MKKGRAYVFDNHLGHSVKNDGKTRRVHLAVDMVGGRRFWGLVKGAHAIGSTPKEAEISAYTVIKDDNARVAFESWSDDDLQKISRAESCDAFIAALSATALQLGLDEPAGQIGEQWCRALRGRSQPRRDEVILLRKMAVARTCESSVKDGVVLDGLRPTAVPTLVDVADAVSAIHRLREADEELRTIGGETVT